MAQPAIEVGARWPSETLLEPVSEQLTLLCAPDRPEDAERVHPPHLERAITLLRPRHDFLVLDVPGHLDDLTLRGLELADQILLVTTPEIASLAQARRRIDLLARVGIEPARVRPILNRGERRAALTTADLREALGQPVSHVLPNAYAVAQDCVNRGASPAKVAPHSALAAELDELALRCHDWLSLRRPVDAAPAGPLARLRSFWRNHVHGTD